LKNLTIRLGKATNSSSTHSILLIPDEEIGKVVTRDRGCEFNFGWEDFILADTESKLRYFAATMVEAMTYMIGKSTAMHIASSLLGVKIFDEDDSSGSYSIYVDHQSVLGGFIPASNIKDDALLHVAKFFRHLAADPHVVIAGGNDNSSYDPADDVPGRPMPGISQFQDVYPKNTGGLIIRPNQQHSYDGDGSSPFKGIVFYNPDNGTKLRYGIEGASFFPEMVDMKITDYCRFGCDFCYQDSTLDGKHAGSRAVLDAIDDLGRYGVFEIAFGGGDPTTHPEFLRFVERAAELNISPNLSTRNLWWIKTFSDFVHDHGGEIAYSMGDSSYGGYDAAQAGADAIHIVMGAEKLKRTVDAVKRSLDHGLRVVLLGWKSSGRAKECPHPYKEQWFEFMSKFIPSRKLSIDSALCRDLPEGSGVPAAFRSLDEEGYHTAYIDVVKQEMCTSSWDRNADATMYKEGYGGLIRAWDRIKRG
jgi:hypothetical protein